MLMVSPIWLCPTVSLRPRTQRYEPGLERSESPAPGASPCPEPDVYTVMTETGSSTESRARQFTELFRTYYGPVLAYARRRVGADMAQDVVAETFLAAWRNVHELPPTPLPWLYRAAHFAIANQRRALARSDRLDGRARQLAGGVIAPDHAELVAADLAIATAIRSLSETDREVLRLAAWEGLTVTAIGEVIGCSACSC